MSRLEPKYFVIQSIEQLLAPETLSRLLAKPITRVACQPLNGHSGLAGGQLHYVDTDDERFVLKRMSIATDWIMFASEDQLCRSVTLWRYGLLDQLRPNLEHRIIACARDGDEWAILMDDLTGLIYTWDKPMPPKLVPVFLDTLARLHATYWNDPRLHNSRLGLCDPSQLLNQTSLPMAQRYKQLSMGVLPTWIREGWEVLAELLDPDVYKLMQNLIENPQPLFDALRRYPYTLLHGDYRAENLAHPSEPVVLDWQEATCSLMTIDLAWFVKHGYVRETMGQLQAVDYYRDRLETYLHQRFDNLDWQAMVDLGYLMDALRIACISGYWYRQHADHPKDRDFLKKDIVIRNQQVRDAARWL